MSRRTIWNTAFLAVTAVAVGMELFASFDSSDSTVPWTFLLRDYVPEPVTIAAMTLLVTWLPVHLAHNRPEGGTMGRYAKTIVAVLVAGLTAATTALSDDQITRPEWVVIGLAALGAIGVFAVPNKTGVTPPEPVPPMRQVTRHDGT